MNIQQQMLDEVYYAPPDEFQGGPMYEIAKTSFEINQKV